MLDGLPDPPLLSSQDRRVFSHAKHGVSRNFLKPFLSPDPRYRGDKSSRPASRHSSRSRFDPFGSLCRRHDGHVRGEPSRILAGFPSLPQGLPCPQHAEKSIGRTMPVTTIAGLARLGLQRGPSDPAEQSCNPESLGRAGEDLLGHKFAAAALLPSKIAKIRFARRCDVAAGENIVIDLCRPARLFRSFIGFCRFDHGR